MRIHFFFQDYLADEELLLVLELGDALFKLGDVSFDAADVLFCGVLEELLHLPHVHGASAPPAWRRTLVGGRGAAAWGPVLWLVLSHRRAWRLKYQILHVRAAATGQGKDCLLLLLHPRLGLREGLQHFIQRSLHVLELLFQTGNGVFLRVESRNLFFEVGGGSSGNGLMVVWRGSGTHGLDLGF